MKFKQLLPVFLATPLFAADSSWLDNERLTGDWGGARTAQEEAGYKFFAYYNAIFAANVDGGNSTDSSYAGDLFMGAEFDLEKIFGWDNTKFVLSGINRHGRSIDEAVGGQYSVMQCVGGQNAFLYNVTLERTFFDDTLSVKLGRLSATDDFVGSPYYGFSVNNSVNGQIRAALFDGVMSSYPFPVWGGRVKYQPNDEAYAMLGVFQTPTDMFDRDAQGVDFKFESGDGVSIFTQVGWNPEFAERPAHFFAGMNTSLIYDMEKFNSTDTRDQFARFYGHADYQVYAESPGSDEGLVLFATLGYSPFQDVAIIPVQSTFGANYEGLFPGRDKDNTVFFATYGNFSNDYAAQQVNAGGNGSEYELVLEIGHRFQVTPSTYIQPDIQYIVNPGGTGDIPNALVLGFQYGAAF